MAENPQELSFISGTVVPRSGAGVGRRGALRAEEAVPQARRPRLQLEALSEASQESSGRGRGARKLYPIRPLLEEWLLDLKVMGRAENTRGFYREKVEGYLKAGGADTLEALNAAELKRHLASLQERDLSDNTVHGSFQAIRGFCNWALREGYPVNKSILLVRAPKVSEKELETYSIKQMQAVLACVPARNWRRLAVEILMGTGMRVSELCALDLTDFEDDGEMTFLKIRRGKGAKFRRVPVSQALRRDIIRYLNRERPDSPSQGLLLGLNGQRVTLFGTANLFRRIRLKVGFPVHAHRFRHTFATEYLRNGGSIDRLMRILGHTTLEMVMRYVHLNKEDLYRDFELRSPL
jgi:site-specific recombinase XerD